MTIALSGGVVRRKEGSCWMCAERRWLRGGFDE